MCLESRGRGGRNPRRGTHTLRGRETGGLGAGRINSDGVQRRFEDRGATGMRRVAMQKGIAAMDQAGALKLMGGSSRWFWARVVSAT